MNEILVDATLFTLQQLGEAAKRLPESLRQQYPNVSWTGIIGLRNIISHNYQGVRLDLIYQISTTDILSLLDHLEQMKP